MQLEKDIAREGEKDALHDSHTAKELREQLSAILGHDLRNPLQAIVVTSELIAKKSTDPEVVALVRRIKVHSKRMASMIDDVLDLTRGRLGGGIGIRIEEVADLAAALRAVVQELQDGHPGRRIIADIAVGRTVRCDIGRMQQLAFHLIGNALAHGAAESPVKVTATAADNDLILEVWNEGQPIPLERKEPIFEPILRHSATRSRPSAGLGLYICAQLVRAHPGEITVTSTQEGGTRFTVRLPWHFLS